MKKDTTAIEAFNLENLSIKRQAIDKKDTLFPLTLNYKEEDGKLTEIKIYTRSQRLWVDWMTAISDCIRDIQFPSPSPS